jgi:hypothetical protein
MRINLELLTQLAEVLLTDENGISEMAYELIYPYLPCDIKRRVEATDGRFYIPSDKEAADSVNREEPKSCR